MGAALLVLLAASIVIAVANGSVDIEPAKVWRIVVAQLTGTEAQEVPRNEALIVWNIRAPRTVLAALVGAGLALAGVIIQALVRNPLADPFILGLSSGAAVGAAGVVLLGWFMGFGTWGLTLAAFLGAIAAGAITFASGQVGGRLDPLRLILAGVAVSFILSALTSFLIYVTEPQATSVVLFWMLGSFGRADWDVMAIPAVVLTVALLWATARWRLLDASAMGDETATTLGLDMNRFRLELFALTTALTAVMVALSGAIGFVGLLVPHAVRIVVGGTHRRLIPIAALAGSIFMVWVDFSARTVVAPQEVPVGVLTALVGGPIFLILLRRRRLL